MVFICLKLKKSASDSFLFRVEKFEFFVDKNVDNC